MNNRKSYNPQEIEKKWQEVWSKNKTYSPNLDKETKPFYNLMMFPYPSAEGLHVGNMYAFTGSDIYGRYKRMQGHEVFEPMGLDGFGIHSENYALKVGRHPIEQAKRSEENFYRQLRSIGNGFDWERKVETYDPDYYRWTQWIFVQLFKKGLAYRKKSPVNFCPSCKTVLADEQVIDGKCERCSSNVEKRDLEQWFFKITQYAERLLKNLDTIDWAEKVKIAQKAWIGKSEGAEIEFKIQDSRFKIQVFTRRPDTSYGITFLVLAPEHPMVSKITTSEQKSHVAQYLEETKKKSEIERTDVKKEKTGVFTGSYAVNPFTNKKIPIWIADYVIAGYGTGAVMGVPGSDHRDFEFAQKYDLPVIQVISKAPGSTIGVNKIEEVLEVGYLVNSEELDGLQTPDPGIQKLIEFLEKKGYGKRKIQFHLRDWLISRQRYWGPPIPMIFCSACEKSGKSYFSTQSGQVPELASNQPQNEAKMAGWFPVAEKDLPVLLPDVENWKPVGTGSSPLAAHPEFYEVVCPECGKPARRETDVSDTFLDSAWYFFRYISTEEKSQAWSPDRAKKWLPVDMYIGGAEHSVLHLLYSRFITMFFKDLGLIDFEEPFTRFYAHGLIIKDGAKMSKSKGNVVVPDDYIRKFGADTLRTYLMFTGPYNMGGDFRDSGVEGMSRFLKRVWHLVTTASIADKTSLDPYFHTLIKEATEDMENLRYNTTIAKIMMYYNALAKKKEPAKAEILALLQLLAPFAPHMTEEIYQALGQRSKVKGQKFESIHASRWPQYDPAMIKSDSVTYAVQVNGKVRSTLETSSSTPKEEVQKLAEESEKVTRFLTGNNIKNVIFVPGKIINFVLE